MWIFRFVVLTALSLFLYSSTIALTNPWEEVPISRWTRDFSFSLRDASVPLPTTNLEQEKIGEKNVVRNLFDQWILNASVHEGRGTHYVEVTRDCKGKIELDFALTPAEWRDPIRRMQYYRSLDGLISTVGRDLLTDFSSQLSDPEKEDFLRALHALVWQESLWQHYVRYKNWFFVILSGGSYNGLDDWGISQVARSSFDPNHLLNKRFFDSKGYCSIGSTLYYGFMEFFFAYLDARDLACNSNSTMDKLLGAYNQYSSGFSSCYDGLSQDKKLRAYQIKAMTGFSNHYLNRPWLAKSK